MFRVGPQQVSPQEEYVIADECAPAKRMGGEIYR